MQIFHSKEYATVLSFYDGRYTERSKMPLINHIVEGLVIMDYRKASLLAQKAFCLHPIVQNDEDVDVTWSESYALACEYRDKANSFLCKPETDHIIFTKHVRQIVGEMSDDCAEMLLADKIQNQKDFFIFHGATHPRRRPLTRYFNLWISFLLTREESKVNVPDTDGEPLLV